MWMCSYQEVVRDSYKMLSKMLQFLSSRPVQATAMYMSTRMLTLIWLLILLTNAKTQRISVCNACESIVVHSAIAEEFLPKLYDKLREHHVQLRCDERAQAILAGRDDVTEAASDDWGYGVS